MRQRPLLAGGLAAPLFPARLIAGGNEAGFLHKWQDARIDPQDLGGPMLR